MKKGFFGWGVYNTTHNFYNFNIGDRHFASGFTREGKIVYTTFDYVNMTADFVVNANVQFDFTSRGTAEHGVGYYDKKNPVRVQRVNAC